MSNFENFHINGKKIVGVALNYIDRFHGNSMDIPDNLVIFLKPTTTYITEGQNIVTPRFVGEIVYGVELGVVIGKKGKNISKENAMQHVAGYCIALDMTALCSLNAARVAGLPWTLSKGFDTATPVSSFISVQEMKNPQNLDMWLKLNGQLKQFGTTSDMIFKIPDIIEISSRYLTLEPNDLILTGTPKGSGPCKAGDIIECGIGDFYKMRFAVSDQDDDVVKKQ